MNFVPLKQTIFMIHDKETHGRLIKTCSYGQCVKVDGMVSLDILH